MIICIKFGQMFKIGVNNKYNIKYNIIQLQI